MKMKKKAKKTMTTKKTVAMSILFLVVAAGVCHSSHARRGGRRGGRRHVGVARRGGRRGRRHVGVVRRGGRRGRRHVGVVRRGGRRGRRHVGVVRRGRVRVGRRGRRRVGVGFGYRDHYYRRPWWGGWWRGYSRYDREDTQGETYWEVFNNTGNSIRVSSDSNSIRLHPSETKRLYRRASFAIQIRNMETGETTERNTINHNVTIN